MDARRASVGRLALAAALLPGWLCACAPAAAPPVAGSPAPAPLASGGAAPVLAWVLGPRDLLSCRTAARDLRRIVRRVGQPVEVRVLAVATPPDYVASFLREERLAAHVAALTADGYGAAFGDAPLPSIYVISRDTVRAAVALSPRGSEAGAPLDQVESALRAALDR